MEFGTVTVGSTCCVCRRAVTQQSLLTNMTEALRCGPCRHQVHPECSGLSPYEYRFVVDRQSSGLSTPAWPCRCCRCRGTPQSPLLSTSSMGPPQHESTRRDVTISPSPPLLHRADVPPVSGNSRSPPLLTAAYSQEGRSANPPVRGRGRGRRRGHTAAAPDRSLSHSSISSQPDNPPVRGRGRGRRRGHTAAAPDRSLSHSSISSQPDNPPVRVSLPETRSPERSPHLPRNSPISFNVNDTIDADDADADEDSIRSTDILTTTSSRGLNQPQPWTVYPGASKRGKDVLVEDIGYAYTLGKSRKNSRYWECSSRGTSLGRCPAMVVEKDGQFRRGRSDHTHEPVAGIHSTVPLSADVRSKASNDVFAPSSAIVAAAMTQVNVVSGPHDRRPNPTSLMRLANRVRSRARPQEPTDLQFDLDDRHMPPSFLRNDVKVRDKRHLIFATDQQLTLLSRAKTWYVDGTFRVVDRPFTQLFSIHAYVKAGRSCKQVPLVYAMMSGKKKRDYEKVLDAVKALLPADRRLQHIVVDYEAAVWSAFQRVFPDAGLRGCFFHYTQAVWRKVQNLGLTNAYLNHTAVHDVVRKLMALPLLPATHIIPAFRQLERRQLQQPDPAMTDVLRYVETTWLFNALWSPATVSVYQQDVRTNNDLEGWHRRLNNVARRANVQFYVLIRLLYTEADSVTLQLHLISDGRMLRRTSKKYKTLNATLKQLWAEYAAGTRSTSSFLRAAARLQLRTIE